MKGGMMSEKRFVLKFDTQENEYFIRDNFEEEEELGSYTLKWGVRKLNEQQDIIEAKDSLLSILSKENEKLRKEVKNRSAFIVDKGLGDTFVRWKNE